MHIHTSSIYPKDEGSPLHVAFQTRLLVPLNFALSHQCTCRCNKTCIQAVRVSNEYRYEKDGERRGSLEWENKWWTPHNDLWFLNDGSSKRCQTNSDMQNLLRVFLSFVKRNTLLHRFVLDSKVYLKNLFLVFFLFSGQLFSSLCPIC